MILIVGYQVLNTFHNIISLFIFKLNKINIKFFLAKIVDVENDQYKFLIKIDGQEIIKHDNKDKDYQEVHPSCLSKL